MDSEPPHRFSLSMSGWPTPTTHKMRWNQVLVACLVAGMVGAVVEGSVDITTAGDVEKVVEPVVEEVVEPVVEEVVEPVVVEEVDIVGDLNVEESEDMDILIENAEDIGDIQVEENILEESIAEEKIAEENIVEEIIFDENIIEENIVDENAVDESIVEENKVEENKVEEQQDPPEAPEPAKEEGPRYRVLFLAPLGSRSHKNFFMGIVKALADRGNHVTMVSTHAPSKEQRNIREVVLEGISIEDMVPNFFQSSTAAPMKVLFQSPDICVKGLGQQAMRDLLKEEFDLVLISMFFSDCFYSVVHQLKVPFVLMSPAGAMGLSDEAIGNPSFTSFTGFPLVEANHPMTFLERAKTTIGNTLATTIIKNYLPRAMESRCREAGLCPADMPSLADIQSTASLLVLNNVRTLDTPARPLMPNIISAGGIHTHPAKPLPQELEEWVQGAGEDGFIFFSLGSAVRPSDMPEEYRQVLVRVFGSLRQRVLWKWNQDSMPDLPPNVRLGKWLPQQDILGHPNLRLFITHGGLHSVMESIYHGIPLLGMPVMGDQLSNMRQVKQDGWGQVVHWKDLSDDTLTKAIQEVMTSASMREEVKRRSRVMRDQPMAAEDLAVYWLEYVIRHKGAPHLRSPFLDMTWYQVYNVDVWVAVAAGAVLLLYLEYRLLRACLSCLCASRRKKKTE